MSYNTVGKPCSNRAKNNEEIVYLLSEVAVISSPWELDPRKHAVCFGKTVFSSDCFVVALRELRVSRSNQIGESEQVNESQHRLSPSRARHANVVVYY